MKHAVSTMLGAFAVGVLLTIAGLEVGEAGAADRAAALPAVAAADDSVSHSSYLGGQVEVHTVVAADGAVSEWVSGAPAAKSADTATVTVECDPSPCRVYAHTLDGSVWDYGSPLEIPPGVYDIHVEWNTPTYRNPRWFVVREAVAVEPGSSSISVSNSEAVHRLHIAPHDENDVLLAGHGYHGELKLLLRRQGVAGCGLSMSVGEPVAFREFYFSDMSDAYSLETAYFAVDADDPFNRPSYLFYAGFSAGVAGDLELGGPANELHRVVIRHPLDPSQYEWELMTGPFNRPYLWDSQEDWEGWGSSGRGCRGPVQPMVPPYRQVVFVQALPEPGFGTGYLWVAPREPEGAHCNRDHFCPGLLCRGPYHSPFLVWDGGLKGYLPGPGAEPLIEEPGAEITLGIGPAFFLGKLDNSPAEVGFGSAVGHYLVPFVGQTGSVLGMDARAGYSLRDSDDNLVAGAWLESGLSESPLTIAVEPGEHRLQVDLDVQHEEWGSPRVMASFDTTAEDPDPPYLTRFSLSFGGERVETLLRPGGEIVFRALDDESGLAAVTASYVASDGPRPLEVEADGDDYRVVLPADMDVLGDTTDLELTLTDAAGNALVTTLTLPVAARAPWEESRMLE